MGKLRLRRGPDLVLVIAASPVKATPSRWAWGLLWELAAHKEAGGFTAGTLGSLGPSRKPSGPRAGQVPMPWASAAGCLPRIEASDQPVWRAGSPGSLFPGLQPQSSLSHLSPGQQLWRKGPSRHLMTREDSESPRSNIPTSPSANTQDSPEVRGNQSLLQIPGDVALPPLKSSRGDSISCWQNTATQRPKSTERRQHNSESDTENTTSFFFFFFVQNT